MKKFLILGTGTSGLIAATLIKKYWGPKVEVSVYYDASRRNIAVGESTTPMIHLFLQSLGDSSANIIQNVGSTIKLGVNFKNWIPNTEYFHGFQEVSYYGINENSSATYSIINDCYNGGLLFDKPSNTVPNNQFDYSHALHIDTQNLCDYVQKKLENEVTFIDDVAEKVNLVGNNIESIDFKKSGNVTADYFIDASGFKSLLLKHFNPKWNDITEYLPIDRAIPQQVPYNFKEVPSYTLAEATDNGWIWQIPIENRYGTGYLYSSKFTSDEEAQEKYNSWLLKNFNTELNTDRIIHYNPGYYDDYWIGNCIAIGLSSGFIEPLESTGIHIIIKQVYEFISSNTNFENLEYNRKLANEKNKKLYEDVYNFICLHYNTNRTDSDFWRYMTKNKNQWILEFEEKCAKEFLDIRSFRENKDFSLWGLDNYIQVCKGLKMFNKDSINAYIKTKNDYERIMESCKEYYEYTKLKKGENEVNSVSHKDLIDFVKK